MKIVRCIILYFFLLFLSVSCTNANADDFSDYPVNNKSKALHANFADHYLVSTYGCGGGAICGEIKNLLTGNRVGFPNAYLIEDDSGENGFLVNYRLNSNLIIISAILADPVQGQENEGFKKRYYLFINDKFVLLKIQ